MKKILLIIFTVFISVQLFSQTVPITDENFEQALIDLGWDTNGLNGTILTSDALKIDKLIIYNPTNVVDPEIPLNPLLKNVTGKIKDISAIKYMPKLTYLYAGYNEIEEIDVSQNPFLGYLDVRVNDLTNIDVSSNSYLSVLNVSFNNLNELDVTDNSNLLVLAIYNNSIRNVDVRSNYGLKQLSVGLNPMPYINLSKNSGLEELDISFTLIAEADLSKNLNLKKLRCVQTNLDELNLLNNKHLTRLDFYNNTKITELNLDNNLELSRLDFYNNTKITELNLFKNTSLDTLYIANNIILDNLNLKNGTNTNILDFVSTGNVKLTCINVDDADYSTTNWLKKDAATTFSKNCFGNTPPVVSNLSLNSSTDSEPCMGETRDHSISYNYSDDDDDRERGTKITWFISNDNVGTNKTEIGGAKNKTRLENSAYRGRGDYYISFEITPSDGIDEGEKVESASFGPFKDPNLGPPSDDCTPPSLVLIKDRNFEQVLIDLGYDKTLNGNVVSDSIKNVKNLNLNNKNISSLNGIGGFSSLETLVCSNNNLETLSLYNNRSLSFLSVENNVIKELTLPDSQKLKTINISNNKIKVVDLSKHNEITSFIASDNSLEVLKMDNGNNTIVTSFNVTNNSSLQCVQVDDFNYATTNWTNIDNVSLYNNKCSAIPPTISNIKVSGSSINERELIVNYDFADVDGYLENSTGYSWYISLDEFGRDIVPAEGKGASSKNYVMEWSDRGKYISVEITPSNGFIYGETVETIKYGPIEEDFTINNKPPSTSSIKIVAKNRENGGVGNFKIDEVIKGEYIYADIDGDLEGDTLFSWYISDDENGTNKKLIENANSIEYTLTSAESGKYISLKVTPKDHLDYGLSVESSLVGPIEEYDPLLVYLQDTNFEQALIDLGLDTNGLNGNISLTDAEAIASLNVSNPTGNSNLPNVLSKITDITGIEAFVNLKSFYCSQNNIQRIDLSNNVSLTVFDARENYLQSLNVANGNNTNFTYFHVENNPSLTCIQVDSKQYSLDNWVYTDKQTGFSEDCSQDDAFSNYFTAVPDVEFEKFLIANKIDTIQDGKFRTIDAHNVRFLNSFSGYKYKNLKGIEAFKDLTRFDNVSSFLESADFSQNLKLETLHITATKIDSLDVSMLVNLKELYCSGYSNRKLKYLNVNGITTLEVLQAQENELTSIDVSTNTNLTWLGVHDNQLTEIDVTNNTELITLGCFDNKLKVLDLSKNKDLQQVFAHRNYLEHVNLKSGKSYFAIDFYAQYNPNLKCVQVDDANNDDVISFIKERTSEDVTITENCNYDGPKNFITKWKTTTSNEIVNIVRGGIDNYNFDVDWGDGTKTENANGSVSHSYNLPGEYLVTMSGNLYEIRMGNSPQLIEVVQWGTNRWRYLQSAFENSENMKITASDSPDLSLPLNLNSMFKGASKVDYNFGQWNISNVVTMPDLLSNSGMSETNYDNTLLAWSQLTNVPRNINFGAEDVYYCNNEVEKNKLINDYNWTIIDAGKGCDFKTFAIPDAIFEQKLIDAGLDTNGLNGNIIKSDADAITDIRFQNDYNADESIRIKDITGIEGMPNITRLQLGNNSISSIDLSKNTKLEYLYLSFNKLNSVDVSNNIGLITLDVAQNNITQIDVNNLTNLTNLWLNNNSISSINISANSKLKGVRLSYNQLDNLDVENNNLIEQLTISGNKLKSIDIKSLMNLKQFYAQQNELISIDISNNPVLLNLDVSNNQLAILDINKNTVITEFLAQNNQLTRVNLKNGNNSAITSLDIRNNSNLTCIQVDDVTFSTNNWTNIDDASVFKIDCTEPIVYIPDANMKAALLADSNINTNGDTEIQVAEAEAITQDIDKGASLNISDLTGIEAFINITGLNVSNNNLISVDLSKNTKLTWLKINDNQLTDLDVSNNSNLILLNCKNNLLTSLNVKNGNNNNFTLFDAKNNPDLICVEVDNKQYSLNNWIFTDEQTGFSEDCSQGDATSNYYTTVPDSDFEKLLINYNVDDVLDGKFITENAYYQKEISTDLHINGEDLRPVDLKGIEAFKSLTKLQTSSYNLVKIDLSHNTNLEEIHIRSTKLTAIDLTSLKSLKILNCDFNSLLTTININGLEKLERIYLPENSLESIDVSTNLKLNYISVVDNKLKILDVSKNTLLEKLGCFDNEIKYLNVSNAKNLIELYAHRNKLEYLNMKTGNNKNMSLFAAFGNPLLECIQVDDEEWSTSVMTKDIDDTAKFSENCTDVWEVYTEDESLDTALNDIPGLDEDGDGKITYEEAQAFTGDLDLSGKNITDVKGLEAFSNATSINLSGNNITDISNLLENTTVTVVSKSTGEKRNIARNNSQGIKKLNVSNNLIEEVDIREVTSITELILTNNKLTYVNLNNNSNNILTKLDVTGNSDLQCIQVDNVSDAIANSNWKKDASASYNTYCPKNALSLNDFLKENVSIYPNPANANILISLKDLELKTIEIYNAIGKRVLKSKSNEIDIRNLSRGIYFIKVNTNKGFINKKLIKE